jgi:hypothetical protein
VFKSVVLRMSAVVSMGLVLLTAAPASAATVTSCPAPNTVAINGGTTIYLQPTGAVDPVSGSQIFQAAFPLTAVCMTASGQVNPIQGVSLAVSATLAPGAPPDIQIGLANGGFSTLMPGITFTGVLPTGATSLGNLPPTNANGQVTVTLDAFSPKDMPYLPAANGFTGFVGLQFDAAVVPTGTTGLSTQQMGIGQIFATPELSSIELFGFGSLAVAGLTAWRARRKPGRASERA